MLRLVFLTSIVALTSGQDSNITYDISKDVDSMLLQANRYFQRSAMTVVPIQEGDFGSDFYHSNGTAMALDSLTRTGVCTYTIDPVNFSFTYDYKLGARLLYLAFNQIEFMGKNQTASFRIKNNSLHIQFTSYKADNRCDIVVQDFTFETLGGIVFSSSSEQYEPAILENYFKVTVLPKANSYMKLNIWPLFQAYLTNSCTRHPTIELGNLFQLFLQPYSESSSR